MKSVPGRAEVEKCATPERLVRATLSPLRRTGSSAPFFARTMKTACRSSGWHLKVILKASDWDSATGSKLRSLRNLGADGGTCPCGQWCSTLNRCPCLPSIVVRSRPFESVSPADRPSIATRTLLSRRPGSDSAAKTTSISGAEADGARHDADTPAATKRIQRRFSDMRHSRNHQMGRNGVSSSAR